MHFTIALFSLCVVIINIDSIPSILPLWMWIMLGITGVLESAINFPKGP